MKGADIILGWISDIGQIHLYDTKAHGNSAPEVDESQDVKLLHGYQNETHTVLAFERPWDTCDPNDLVLNSDTTRLIWSYHDQDPIDINSLIYHGSQRRGVRSVYLQEMPQAKLKNDDFKVWNLTSQVELVS